MFIKVYTINHVFTLPYNNTNLNCSQWCFIGKLVQEVHQYHNEWIGQVIRLYKGADHIEFDWVIGPIPIE